MGSPNTRRREPRYLIQLPIALTLGRRALSVVTEDVSFSGIFLRAELTLPLRHLIRFEMTLPPHNEPFKESGTLTHIIPRGPEGREPGAGLELYGLGREAQATWDRFIDHVRAHYPEAGARAEVFPRAERFEPLHRRRERHVAVLRVHLQSLDDLRLLYSRDVSRGGMFLLTGHTFAVGDEVGLQVIHPHTDDVFETSCVVQRTVREHGVAGIGVELVEPEEDLRRFDEFIYDGIAGLFDEESVRDDEPR